MSRIHVICMHNNLFWIFVCKCYLSVSLARYARYTHTVPPIKRFYYKNGYMTRLCISNTTNQITRGFFLLLFYNVWFYYFLLIAISTLKNKVHAMYTHVFTSPRVCMIFTFFTTKEFIIILIQKFLMNSTKGGPGNPCSFHCMNGCNLVTFLNRFRNVITVSSHDQWCVNDIHETLIL